MTNERDLSVIDDVIADLEAVLERLKARREEQETRRADEG